ncbi:MAG: hypothetical protein ACON4O_08265 [Lentimonas sp.]
MKLLLIPVFVFAAVLTANAHCGSCASDHSHEKIEKKAGCNCSEKCEKEAKADKKTKGGKEAKSCCGTDGKCCSKKKAECDKDAKSKCCGTDGKCCSEKKASTDKKASAAKPVATVAAAKPLLPCCPAK